MNCALSLLSFSAIRSDDTEANSVDPTDACKTR